MAKLTLTPQQTGAALDVDALVEAALESRTSTVIYPQE